MPASGFRSAGHRRTLVAALLHFDVSFMVWVLLGALGAYIAADLGLSGTQKGLMIAVPPLGGSVFRLLIGSVGDRVGLKRMGQATLALTLVPLAWGWLAAGTYAEVLAIGLLLGVAGASFVVALPLVSRWYPPEHQGLALGIAGAGNSGTLVAVLAAPRLAEHVGWRGVMGLAALPIGAVWLAFSILAKEPPQPTVDRTSLRSLLQEADARWLCAFYMVSFGGFVGLSSYLSIFFVDRFDLTKVTAGGFAALCAAAGSFLRPLGGSLADRRGGTKVLIWFLSSAAVLLLALTSLPALAPTVLLLFLLLGALGMANGAVFQLVPQRYPQRVAGVTGLVGAAGGLGGFVIPFALGSLEDLTGTFSTGFLLYAAVVTGATWAMARRQIAWRRAWQLEVAI
jgi:MFS transporter, NNP family, nitrate/nitrite transporter